MLGDPDRAARARTGDAGPHTLQHVERDPQSRSSTPPAPHGESNRLSNETPSRGRGSTPLRDRRLGTHRHRPRTSTGVVRRAEGGTQGPTGRAERPSSSLGVEPLGRGVAWPPFNLSPLLTSQNFRAPSQNSPTRRWTTRLSSDHRRMKREHIEHPLDLQRPDGGLLVVRPRSSNFTARGEQLGPRVRRSILV